MKWWRYCSSETGCWAFTPDAHLPRVQRKWIPDHTFQDGLSSGPIPGMKTCFTLHQTYWSLRAHCSLTPPKSKTKRNLHHQSSEFVASPHVKGRDSSLHSVLDESSLKRVCGTETSDGLDQKQPTVFHRDCVGENVGHETWSLLWWRQWLKQIKPGCQYFNLN